MLGVGSTAGTVKKVGCEERLQKTCRAVKRLSAALNLEAAVQSVEAARESGMAAVVVAGQQPLYELGAADLVVRQLDELTLINLKQLFRNEAHVEGGAVRPA